MTSSLSEREENASASGAAMQIIAPDFHAVKFTLVYIQRAKRLNPQNITYAPNLAAHPGAVWLRGWPAQPDEYTDELRRRPPPVSFVVGEQQHMQNQRPLQSTHRVIAANPSP